MTTAKRGLPDLGFAFDPFEHLDSARDVHLQSYMVIPRAVESALAEQPLAVFAQPGGGKSALRIYASNFYRDSRGVRFPITYVPDGYSADPGAHFSGIETSLARAVLIYLVSYPDLFSSYDTATRREIKRILQILPFGLDFNLGLMQSARFITDLEQTLGVSAFSGLKEMGMSHRDLGRELQALKAGAAARPSLGEQFDLLNTAFGAKSIHLLVDGLDGFMETSSAPALLKWIEPLFEALQNWEAKNIHLKVFLPMDIADAPSVARFGALRTATLAWDDHLLAEIIRKRVFAASSGVFDTLDAISAPDVRGSELTLARQLPGDRKLPRHIIMKCKKIIDQIPGQGWITNELLNAKEAAHDGIL